MKFAIWIYAVTVVLASLAVTALGGAFSNIFRSWLHGKPLPAMTAFLVDSHLWALAIPLPWLFAAVWLSRGETATTDRVFAYAATSTLAIVFLFVFTAVALALPLVTVTVCMQ